VALVQHAFHFRSHMTPTEFRRIALSFPEAIETLDAS
jgi:hypothetical protein